MTFLLCELRKNFENPSSGENMITHFTRFNKKTVPRQKSDFVKWGLRERPWITLINERTKFLGLINGREADANWEMHSYKSRSAKILS